MGKNSELQTAQNNKKDEFYTQYEDIEAELKHYKKHFKNKIIFCNCDDPEWSNFWKYLKDNFNTFKLKKLISTHYEKDKTSYKLEYDGREIVKTDLEGDGDFRSDECIEILKEANIIITNPPFSLFRPYISQLIKYKKKFIIIGNVNAITYKEVFPLFKKNKLWLGHSIHSGDREFRVPKDYPLEAAGYRTDVNGNNYIRVKGVRWFTNLNYDNRYQNLPLTKEYNPNDYPKYDNYDAINVSKTADIPSDYFGAMGVPITFMDKYNPKQFEIIGNSSELAGEITLNEKVHKKPQRFYLNGKRMYDRIVIRRKTEVEA